MLGYDVLSLHPVSWDDCWQETEKQSTEATLTHTLPAQPRKRGYEVVDNETAAVQGLPITNTAEAEARERSSIAHQS